MNSELRSNSLRSAERKLFSPLKNVTKYNNSMVGCSGSPTKGPRTSQSKK